MTGLFGFLASRPQVGASVLSADAGPVEVREAGESLRWGVGYFEGDEILLRRRPADPRTVVPIGQMVANVQANQLIGYYGSAKLNAMHTDDTHPFRYRTWLFAHAGVIDARPAVREKLMQVLPDFLRASLRGETPGELLFHMFLANLHEQGRLQTGTASAGEVRTALRQLVDQLEMLTTSAGAARPELNVIVANGEFIVAARTGRGILYREVGSRELMEQFDQAPSSRRDSDSASTRVSIIASHVIRNASAYRAVPARSLLTLTEDDEPACEPLERRTFGRVPAAA